MSDQQLIDWLKEQLIDWLKEHLWRDGFPAAKIGLYRADMAEIEARAFINFLLEQGLLAPVDQGELILCDLGVSHRLSSVEAMTVSAWHNAARKSRHQRWRDNDTQDTEFIG